MIVLSDLPVCVPHASKRQVGQDALELTVEPLLVRHGFQLRHAIIVEDFDSAITAGVVIYTLFPGVKY